MSKWQPPGWDEQQWREEAERQRDRANRLEAQLEEERQASALSRELGKDDKRAMGVGFLAGALAATELTWWWIIPAYVVGATVLSRVLNKVRLPAWLAIATFFGALFGSVAVLLGG